MNFEDALETQLQTICLHENCSLEIKYAAARELQMRQWKEEMVSDLVLLWGKGLDSFSIAIELGVEQWQVKQKLTKYGLWKKRVKVS